MKSLAEHVGNRIRMFRKAQGVSVEQLAAKIHKSKATLYKYENGKISVDVDTLSDICSALNIEAAYFFDRPLNKKNLSVIDSFFNTGYIYTYYYDGRIRRVVSSLLVIRPINEEGIHHVSFFMNIADFTEPEQSRYMYSGTLSSHETVSYVIMQNITLPIETMVIQVVHPFQTSQSTWGLFLGLSDQPLAPMATKMLFSRVQYSKQDLLDYPLIFTKEELKSIQKQNALILSIRQ